VSAYAMLVIIVGGRMIPSFTRNWLNRLGRTDFPVPYNGFDTLSILSAAAAFAAWVLVPEAMPTTVMALVAALLHTARLWRWRGWTTSAEPLITVLHVAYAFVPLGFCAIGLAALGAMDTTSAVHVLTVGTIASMMLAVMTRATRGHTGRELAASKTTCISYIAIVACAFTRPIAGQWPELAPILYPVSALLWLLAFGSYLWEYAPMLVNERRKARS